MKVEIPADLSKLDLYDLNELYSKTGSKRLAAAIYKLSQPPVVNEPIAPVVAPRPGGTPKGFRPPRWESRGQRWSKTNRPRPRLPEDSE
jgi:hypothetical protein